MPPRLVLTIFALLCLPVFGKAAPPVSYSRQVLPILQRECLACHGGANPASGYAMDTRDHLLKGGRHGEAIRVGKGTESNLIRYMTGDLKPKMPPNGAMDLDRIALLRRWIDEGAKVDSTVAITPKQSTNSYTLHPAPYTLNLSAPVTALSYSPDGKILAAGGYRVVRLLDSATGALLRVVNGAADQIQAVAWSSDGKILAVAGGLPGVSGEILLYETTNWKQIRALAGHTEVVYALSWKNGTQELASGSLDKTARIWNAETGQCTRIIKDHADAVFGVAYSPDGKMLATGSADRSAKIFDTTSWKRLVALTAHNDGINRVAFNPTGTLLATAGADKRTHIWKVKIGDMENPQHTVYDDDTISDCVFGSDGSLFLSGRANHLVKIFNEDGGQQKRETSASLGWLYCVAVGKDSQTVAAGTQDGNVCFWNVKEGKLLRSVQLSPQGAKVETPPEMKK